MLLRGEAARGKDAPDGAARGDRAATGGPAIGPYRLLREIGRGGQATVWLAEDDRLRRLVALKVLDPAPGGDVRAFQRFRREAEITSRLDHPGICAVYETGEERGSLWIAMRYVEGESLAREIDSARKRGPATWSEVSGVLGLFEKIARTLHVAHEHGVIHRDIKPGNLMITREREPVILDFGLAQDEHADQPALTLSSDTLGTPAYMSPEQIARPQAGSQAGDPRSAARVRLDRRTDVYSLGVSLYECLTLRRPFSHPTREGLYRAILLGNPPDVRGLNDAVPRDLAVVLATALEKDRSRRYQTALDLAEDLRRVRAREPILAKPAGVILRARRFSQRNPALATAVCCVLVALVISVILLVRVTAERDEKLSALADYDRLGDRSRLEQLVAEAEALWPAEPSNVGAMRHWMGLATDLTGRLDRHSAALERIRGAGRLVAPESRGGASRPADSRAVWSFASTSEQFKHDTTAKLVADLTAFVEPAKGLLASMCRRLEFAESVDRETIERPAARWADAIRSIADLKECPRYAGLRIRPQRGLIPIGRDPDSGLWEFVHLQTAGPGADPIPRRGGDGSLAVTESGGVVLVLLPGGAFRMGAARPAEEEAPTDANVDPDASDDEAPVNEVRIDPFFLSKYEMTQGQWQRSVGHNPSQYAPGGEYGGKVVDFRHPVEQVTWEECSLWLPRYGLVLPTEAQWEYAARAGTTTPRWTGTGPDGLGKAANLADLTFHERGGVANLPSEPWDDGWVVHAPVGSLAPNPFGLHDVYGNVSEWCRDAFVSYSVAPDRGDGLRHGTGPNVRCTRGGGFNHVRSLARSAYRGFSSPKLRAYNLGVRPARPLDA